MKKLCLSIAALALPAIALAQTGEAEATAPSPNQIVDAATPEEWVSIPADDLLVMTLAPDRDGNAREVVIQLMPEPFSQGWVHNIKLLARSGWYDGISVNRVQDNYVVQWGDPNYDNPESGGEAKPLPYGLKVMGEDEYVSYTKNLFDSIAGQNSSDLYASQNWVRSGWPLAGDDESRWPVHCYGMVGVGRNYSPDTGSGAELYTVIGHAPRHLDRNIALVGRVIEGMEHLSSLPRGKGELGFYADFEKDKRTPILSVRIASDRIEFPMPSFEYLSTESESFARYAEARANRRDPFFIHPAGGADICNIPVPVRRVVGE
ncbi:peptidylprolyl isomerase [Altererythrobacter sp. GH1-8]|uniref:peptidylprolyl isomerase n=1 Tax=Altererythrobacter sp. GH1-8 TaxID=3349333 RepID=UPI00374D9DD6